MSIIIKGSLFWWKKYLCRWVKDGAKWRGGEAGELPWRGGGDWEGHTEGSEALCLMGQSQGFVADAGWKGIPAPS